MFEVIVQDIFSITGRGTIFAGEIRSGSISVGDPVICKTPSKEIHTRVISLEELGSGRSLQNAEAGARVGVLCKQIDHKSLGDAFEGEGENARPVGVTLIPGIKKKWWQL
jgi:selenocysteine-specific translation elongation factor